MTQRIFWKSWGAASLEAGTGWPEGAPFTERWALAMMVVEASHRDGWSRALLCAQRKLASPQMLRRIAPARRVRAMPLHGEASGVRRLNGTTVGWFGRPPELVGDDDASMPPASSLSECPERGGRRSRAQG